MPPHLSTLQAPGRICMPLLGDKSPWHMSTLKQLSEEFNQLTRSNLKPSSFMA